MTHARSSLAAIVERLLFISAALLLAWVAWQGAVRQYYARRPVALASLPGDTGRTTPVGLDARTRPAPGTVLARLSIPAVQLETTVLEGSTDDMLARSAGHIEETALPGSRGNVGIAGHRDTTFRPLRRIGAGDRLTLATARSVRHYRVERTWVVTPEDVWVLGDTSAPAVTLVTCYPFTFFGHAPQRFIVRAVEEPVELGATSAR